MANDQPFGKFKRNFNGVGKSFVYAVLYDNSVYDDGYCVLAVLVEFYFFIERIIYAVNLNSQIAALF